MRTHNRLAIAFLCLIASVAAQQPNPSAQPSPATSPPSTGEPQKLPGDEDVVRITTNLVQVDAVVTDKSGKHITDLRPDLLADERHRVASQWIDFEIAK
jgi:hypothetical protein